MSKLQIEIEYDDAPFNGVRRATKDDCCRVIVKRIDGELHETIAIRHVPQTSCSQPLMAAVIALFELVTQFGSHSQIK